MPVDWLLGGAVVLWLVGVFVAASLQRNALGRLTPEEKVRLVDAASGRNLVSSVIFVAVVGGFFLGAYFFRQFSWQLVVAALVAVLALTLVSSVVTYRRLRNYGLPDHFLRAFRIGRSLRLATAAVFFAVVALTLRR